MKNSILSLLVLFGPLICNGQQNDDHYGFLGFSTNFGYFMPTDSNTSLRTFTPSISIGRTIQGTFGLNVNLLDSNFTNHTSIPRVGFEFGFNGEHQIGNSSLTLREGLLFTAYPTSKQGPLIILEGTGYWTSRIFVDVGYPIVKNKGARIFLRFSRQFDKRIYYSGNRLEIGINLRELAQEID